MPWPISTSHNSSCCYQQCEAAGHSVCHQFADYYQRLCAAAIAAVDNPTGERLAHLQETLNEHKGLIND
jgi:hypothetical protein